MSQALRKITGSIKKSNTLVIFINQIRMKIGVMFGSPETTSGGNALKFYSSVRLDIRRIGTVKDGDEVAGNETELRLLKIKFHHHSDKLNFKFFTTKVLTVLEKFSILELREKSLRRQVLGTLRW